GGRETVRRLVRLTPADVSFRSSSPQPRANAGRFGPTDNGQRITAGLPRPTAPTLPYRRSATEPTTGLDIARMPRPGRLLPPRPGRPARPGPARSVVGGRPLAAVSRAPRRELAD